MKFETQNFIQKNQKEKEMKKFLKDFDNLITSKLEKSSMSSTECDKALFVFETARSAKLFWLWLSQSEKDFDLVRNKVECYGFGDRIFVDMIKDINNISHMDCEREIKLEKNNPTHKSAVFDDIMHFNMNKNANYLTRVVKKEFRYTHNLKT